MLDRAVLTRPKVADCSYLRYVLTMLPTRAARDDGPRQKVLESQKSWLIQASDKPRKCGEGKGRRRMTIRQATGDCLQSSHKHHLAALYTRSATPHVVSAPASCRVAAAAMLLLDYQNVLIESLLKDRFSG
jgi:hypothetical protein